MDSALFDHLFGEAPRSAPMSAPMSAPVSGLPLPKAAGAPAAMFRSVRTGPGAQAAPQAGPGPSAALPRSLSGSFPVSIPAALSPQPPAAAP